MSAMETGSRSQDSITTTLILFVSVLLRGWQRDDLYGHNIKRSWTGCVAQNKRTATIRYIWRAGCQPCMLFSYSRRLQMRFQLASGVQYCNAASVVKNARLKQSNDLFLCSTHALHPRHAGSKCIAAPHGSGTTFILGWVSGIQLDKDRCIGNPNMRSWLLLAVLHPRAEMRMEASKRRVRLLVSEKWRS